MEDREVQLPLLHMSFCQEGWQLMRDQKKRIVIAPDSFKGTMTAIEVCRIIRKAFLQVDSALEICCLPMADGGEGTVDAFLSALGGERKTLPSAF